MIGIKSFIAIFIVWFLGLIWLSATQRADQDRHNVKQCQSIADIAGTPEYLLEQSTCYIIKDDKLKQIKL